MATPRNGRKRTKKTAGRTFSAVKATPAGLVVAAAPLPPAERVWVPGPAYVFPLGDLARAVQERRGREALGTVTAAAAALDDLTKRAVALARAEGATWAEVGAVFGITRQSAQVRWREAPRVSAERACHFAGARDGCQQVATTRRGAVPLCEPCEAGSSSLKRLPLARLPRTVAGST